MASLANIHGNFSMTAIQKERAMDVRALTEADLTAWSGLLALAFERTPSDMAALLRWMIQGWGLIAYGVWDGEILAAQYSCLQARLFSAEMTSPLPVGMSVNMATHPDYRGRGLIKHAAAPVYQTLQEQGICAGVGFSNAAGVKVDRHSKGYGYQVVGQLQPLMVLPSLRRHPSLDFSLTTQLPPLDGLFHVSPQLHFDVTAADINHRFGRHPFRNYHYGLWSQGEQVLGVVIFQHTRLAGLPTASLLAAYGQDLEGLLARWLNSLNAGTFVHTLTTPTSQVRAVLERLKATVSLPWQNSPYYLTVKPMSDAMPTHLMDFSAWDCMGGHIL